MFKRFLGLFLIFSFLLTNIGYMPNAQADALLNLPQPGVMLAPSVSYAPVVLKGMMIHSQEPLKFDFIIDAGTAKFNSHDPALRIETNRLIKYFLTAITIPESDLWVNLSPYEKDRIVPQALGETVLGKDLLAQDYELKQLTASLIYPEKQLGHDFWQKVYAEAQKKFGTTQIPVNTFNKVWILPDAAEIYQRNGAVYITRAHLKVMLDEDYLSLQKHNNLSSSNVLEGNSNTTHSIASQVIRQLILPEIEKEVNEGKNFSLVRQMYYSLILAKWYKETIKQSLLSRIYQDKNKIKGVDLDDKTLKDKIYARYIQAYKKGVFNYIKEEAAFDPESKRQGVFPRKYFSGGLLLMNETLVDNPQVPKGLNHPAMVAVVNLNSLNPAMIDHSIDPDKNLDDEFLDLGALLERERFERFNVFVKPPVKGGWVENLGSWLSFVDIGFQNSDGQEEKERIIKEIINCFRKGMIEKIELESVASERGGFLRRGLVYHTNDGRTIRLYFKKKMNISEFQEISKNSRTILTTIPKNFSRVEKEIEMLLSEYFVCPTKSDMFLMDNDSKDRFATYFTESVGQTLGMILDPKRLLTNLEVQTEKRRQEEAEVYLANRKRNDLLQIALREARAKIPVVPSAPAVKKDKKQKAPKIFPQHPL